MKIAITGSTGLVGTVLCDHFKKKGLGIGTTYAGALPGLKIDYIFADDNFKVS